MKKIKRVGLRCLMSAASISLACTGILTTCCVQNNEVPGKLTGGKLATYHTITFTNPTGTEYDDVIFVGKTKVSIKDGYAFGTVVAPRAVKDGWTLEGWSETVGGTLITKTTPITKNTILYPVMNPVGSTLTISGEQTLYDGFGQTPTYTASMTSGDATKVKWSVTDLEGHASSALTLSTEVGATTIATITFTKQKVECYIVAQYGEGAEEITAKLLVTIYPPYYRSDEVEIDEETVDTGILYWGAVDSGSSTGWIGLDPETICSQDSQICIYYFFEDDIDDTAERDDADWAAVTDVYPGSEVYAIEDDCWANVTYFNALIHGGVYTDGREKIISKIGNEFLANCVNYNQDISEVFDFDGALAIGDGFMDGCTGFNNGATAGTPIQFTIPCAAYIGDYFMADCTGLNGEVILNKNNWYIGEFFMNGCSSISTVTIPSTCQDVLQRVGGWFLADCDNLSQIHVRTTDVNYFADLHASWSDKGSFVWFGTPTTPEKFIFVDGEQDSVNAIMDNYTNITLDNYYRRLSRGSVTGKSVYIPPFGSQAYYDMFEPLADPVTTNEANVFKNWMGTFKNIKITSPNPIGTITADVQLLDCPQQIYILSKMEIQEVESGRTDDGEYYKNIWIKLPAYPTAPQRKNGFPTKITLKDNGVDFFTSSDFLYKIDKQINLSLVDETRVTEATTSDGGGMRLAVKFNYENPYGLTFYSGVTFTDMSLPNNLSIYDDAFTYDDTTFTKWFYIRNDDGTRVPEPGNYTLSCSVMDAGGASGTAYDYYLKNISVPFTIKPTLTSWNSQSQPRIRDNGDGTYEFFCSSTVAPLKLYSQPTYESSALWVEASVNSQESVSSGIDIVDVGAYGVLSIRPHFTIRGTFVSGQTYRATLRFYSSYVPGENKLIGTFNISYICL